MFGLCLERSSEIWRGARFSREDLGSFSFLEVHLASFCCF